MRDKFCKSGLVVIPVFFTCIVISLVALCDGAYYLPAIVASILAGVLILMTLSMPLHVKIDERGVEIVCIVEVTSIPLEQIESVEWFERLPLSESLPIWYVVGFGGYYGYCFSLSKWCPFKVYASHRGRGLLIRRKGMCDIVSGGFLNRNPK